MTKDRLVDDLLDRDPRVGSPQRGDRSVPVILAQDRDLDADVLPAGSHPAGPQWPVYPHRLGSGRGACGRRATVLVCAVSPHLQCAAVGSAAASQSQSTRPVGHLGLAGPPRVGLVAARGLVSAPL